MNVLYLEATQDTPRIFLNQKEGVFEVSGRSLPEDSETFYQPVIDWLNQYAEAPNPSTVFSFNLKYFNSASSKLIYDVLETLRKVKGASVQWMYQKDDEDILDAGKEFEEEFALPFSYKEL